MHCTQRYHAWAAPPSHAALAGRQVWERVGVPVRRHAHGVPAARLLQRGAFSAAPPAAAWWRCVMGLPWVVETLANVNTAAVSQTIRLEDGFIFSCYNIQGLAGRPASTPGRPSCRQLAPTARAANQGSDAQWRAAQRARAQRARARQAWRSGAATSWRAPGRPSSYTRPRSASATRARPPSPLQPTLWAS
jgi:hypothetical protein